MFVWLWFPWFKFELFWVCLLKTSLFNVAVLPVLHGHVPLAPMSSGHSLDVEVKVLIGRYGLVIYFVCFKVVMYLWPWMHMKLYFPRFMIGLFLVCLVKNLLFYLAVLPVLHGHVPQTHLSQ